MPRDALPHQDVQPVGVAIIHAINRLRRLDPGKVAEIAQSIEEVGLLSPILIRRDRSIKSGYVLVAGLHRLEAVRRLGWPQIPAIILDVESDEAELAEIDENLMRGELSPAERALHVTRRKEIYERLHPETTHGGDRKSDQVANFATRSESFTAETAKRTGRAERTVRLDAARGEKVADLHKVVGTSLDQGQELDALASLPEPEQKAIIERAASGENVSARTVAKQVRRAAREQELGAKIVAQPPTDVDASGRLIPMFDALSIGRAAEHAVCADLLMKGYNAFLSSQGSPYEVVVERGARLYRIQVKASTGVRDVNARGRNERLCYSFSVRRRGKNGSGNLTPGDTDLVALVATDIGAIAYFALTDDFPQTVQLSAGEIKPGAFARAFDRPITEYGLEEALAQVDARQSYVDLLTVYPPFPRRKYGVIYADPCWSFETWSENGMDRSADNHYPTLDEATLRGIGPYVPASSDSALFLWATVPMLPEALDVMAAWGFEYKSHLVWLKDKAGTGYWSRNKHELLLIGTRGEIPAPAPGSQPMSAMTFPVTAHSEKPTWFRDWIAGLYPTLPKLEMFARDAAPGWDVCGAEAPE